MSVLFCFFVFVWFFLNVQTGRPVSALRLCLAGPDCLRRAGGTIHFVAGRARNVGGMWRKPFCFISAPAFCLRPDQNGISLCFSHRFGHSLVSLTAALTSNLCVFSSTSTEYKWLRGSERAAKSSPVFFLCVTLSPLRPNIYRFIKTKKINRTATIGTSHSFIALDVKFAQAVNFGAKCSSSRRMKITEARFEKHF